MQKLGHNNSQTLNNFVPIDSTIPTDVLPRELSLFICAYTFNLNELMENLIKDEHSPSYGIILSTIEAFYDLKIQEKYSKDAALSLKYLYDHYKNHSDDSEHKITYPYESALLLKCVCSDLLETDKTFIDANFKRQKEKLTFKLDFEKDNESNFFDYLKEAKDKYLKAENYMQEDINDIEQNQNLRGCCNQKVIRKVNIKT